MGEIFFVVEIKKNNIWISIDISSTSLQEVNKNLAIYLSQHSCESRIIQKMPISNLKQKRKGCC